MQARFSPTSRVIYLFMTALFIWGLGAASFGWSRNETAKFCEFIFGRYAGEVANFIQFSPNIFFAIAGLFKKLPKEMRYALYGLGISFNLVDWYTNEVAFRLAVDADLLMRVPLDLQASVEIAGHVSAFLVTWAEEPMALAAGFFIFLLGEVLDDFFGWQMPEWASRDIKDFLESASGLEPVLAASRPSGSMSTPGNLSQKHTSKNGGKPQRPNNVTISQMPPDRQNNGRPSFSTHALREMELGDDEE